MGAGISKEQERAMKYRALKKAQGELAKEGIVTTYCKGFVTGDGFQVYFGTTLRASNGEAFGNMIVEILHAEPGWETERYSLLDASKGLTRVKQLFGKSRIIQATNPDEQGRPQYYTDANHEPPFTTDANKAARFGDEVVASATAEALGDALMDWTAVGGYKIVTPYPDARLYHTLVTIENTVKNRASFADKVLLYDATGSALIGPVYAYNEIREGRISLRMFNGEYRPMKPGEEVYLSIHKKPGRQLIAKCPE